jgi:hypothetical protein
MLGFVTSAHALDDGEVDEMDGIDAGSIVNASETQPAWVWPTVNLVPRR